MSKQCQNNVKTMSKRIFLPLSLLLAVFLVAGVFCVVKFGVAGVATSANLANSVPFKFTGFKVGDLIFRRGNGADSLLIALVSDFKYSHVGVVVSVSPVLIIHATTDDDVARPNQVIVSKLEEFLRLGSKFGVGRVGLTEAQRGEFARNLRLRLGEKFLLKERVATKTNLYCTTLVEQELGKFVDFRPAYTRLDTPLFKGEFLLPKAIFYDKNVEILYENE